MNGKGKKSTIVFTVLLAVVIVALCIDCYILNVINPNRYDELDPSGAMAMLVIIVFFAIPIVLSSSVGIIVVSSLGLPYCIINVKSDSKPIRVINIILICFYSAGLVLAPIVIIFLGVFVL